MMRLQMLSAVSGVITSNTSAVALNYSLHTEHVAIYCWGYPE